MDFHRFSLFIDFIFMVFHRFRWIAGLAGLARIARFAGRFGFLALLEAGLKHGVSHARRSGEVGGFVICNIMTLQLSKLKKPQNE